MRTKLLTTLQLLATALLLVHCSSDKKASVKTAPLAADTKEYFVQGDPLKIIAGTKLNSTPFFTLDNQQEFQNYILASKIKFLKKTPSQKLKKDPTNTDDLEAISQEETTPPIPPTEVEHFNFEVASSNDPNSLAYSNKSQTTQFYFIKNKSDSNFEMRPTAKIDGAIVPIFPLHFSLSEDRKMFSILIYDSQNESLLSYYFIRPETEDITEHETQGNPKYLFHYGPGVKSRWSKAKPLEISICGSTEYTNTLTNEKVDASIYYQLAIEKWQSALGDRLQIKLNTIPQDYPPFSDLNTHCIYVVDDYLVVESDKYIRTAESFYFHNAFSYQAQHAFIIIWNHEFKTKNKTSFFDDLLLGRGYKVILHELGHFLGLTHQDDNTIKSIMSYDENIRDLEEYDIKAIKHLYSD